MKKWGQKPTTARHGHRSSRNTTPLDTNPSQDRNLYSRSGQRFDPNGYSSSQGKKVEESHMSATCRFPSNGHNKLATRLNIIGEKTWNKECINRVPTEWGGTGLDKDIININENYMNYIHSNPKLLLTMDDLSVADTETMGHYLTLDSPCSNK